MTKTIPIPGKDEKAITNQDLYEMHQSFQLIATSQNPMWRAVFFLQKKAIDKFYQAKCASDNIPNSAKVNSLVKYLNNLQQEYMEYENDQPKIDAEKPQVNGQPVFILKEGKTIEQFNEESAEYLARMVWIKV